MNIKRCAVTGPLAFMLALFAVFVSWGSGYEETKGLLPGNGIAMEVTYGYDNTAKGGRYVPLDVSLVNQGTERFEGTLKVLSMELDYEVYQYAYPLEMEAGESLEKYLYIPMGNRSDQLFVTVEDARGTQMIHKRLKMDFSLDVPELFVGILSDTPESLMSCWNGVGVDYGMLRTRTIAFDTHNFPDQKLGLDMIDVMLISNYRIRDLSEEQSQVLIEWVRDGGTMILGTGMRADDTLGRFAPELLEEMYEAPQIRQVDMGADYAKDRPGDSQLEIPCVEFALSGGNVIMSDESQPLLSAVTYRRGTVAVAAYDFVDIAEFCRENPSYLDDLLTGVLGESRINSLAESVYSGNSGQFWSVRDMINTGNVRRLPNLGLYTMEIIIYLLLAGVGLYVFLKQRDLTEYYRSGVVALSAVFTAIIWLMGSRTRFRDTFYTYACFMEVTWDTVSETAYMNIRAPYNRPYEAHLAADYSVKPVTQNYYGTGTSGMVPLFTGGEEPDINLFHHQDETHMTIRNVPAFEPRYFQLEKAVPNTEGIGFSGDIEVDQGRYTGTVTSNFTMTMENCVVLLYGKLIWLGDMEPGESRSLDGLEVLGFPMNNSYEVAAWLSGESQFERTDISDESYVEAVEKTNLLTFYLDNFMPEYSPNAKVVGICGQGEGEEARLLRSAQAEGKTVAASDINVYSSNDEVIFRSGLVKTPVVLGGSYDSSNNTLFGADPVTLEYSLGNDVRIEKLIFDWVSPEFVTGGAGRNLNLFQGNIYFYNHGTGKYDRMDSMKDVYEAYELAPYLSPGNTITVKYVYENMTDYNWNVLLPMLDIVGRED